MGKKKYVPRPLSPGPRNALIYDAECRLCVSSKRRLERWDRRGRITFLPFQTEEAKRLVPDLASIGCLDAIRFIDAEGEISSGVDAVRNMARLLPLGGVVTVLFYIPGFDWIAVRLYRWIAENRYRWFGEVPEKG